MDWMEVCVTVPCADVERAEAIAHMVVPYGIYIEDYSDLEQGAREIAHIDLIDEELLQRDRTRAIIHLYVSPESNPAEAAAFLQEHLKQEGIAHELVMTPVQEADWANNWKQYFKPLAVGKKLLICPTWESADNADGRTVLSVDPGMAFGTGGHDTTRLVLETLEQFLTPDTTVLDVGCGSGILSIAALTLGAASAAAVDIDDKCLTVAYENAALNGIGRDRYTVLVGDAVSDRALKAQLGGGYDIVVANIVADVIIGLSGQVRPFLKEGGLFLCSGIIDTRADEVADALRHAGWTIEDTRSGEGWYSYTCR